MTFKKFSLFFILFSVIFSCMSAGIFAEEYIYEGVFFIETNSTANWKADALTSISASRVEYSGESCVSFTASGSFFGEHNFTVPENVLAKDPSDVMMRLKIYISNAEILDNSATFGTFGIFLEGDSGAYYWDISDMNLKSGWNTVSFNLRTAEIVLPSGDRNASEGIAPIPEPEPDGEEPENGAEDEAEPENSADKDAENEDNVINDDAEKIAEISPEEIKKLRFEANISGNDTLTVAFHEIELAVLTLQKQGEIIVPITDEHSDTSIIFAVSFALLLLACVSVYCVIYAKNEAKRLRKLRKKEKNKTKQKSEDENGGRGSEE